MRLLERESQLEALAEYALEASRGQGRLVLVSGEAGVGKSSLLEQLEGSLDDAQWFWGACDGLFTPRPLSPLLDIASQLGGELFQLCRTGAPRDSLFEALLAKIKEPGALKVFAIEDIHWADEATLDLLRFLGRRLRDAQALLLVTFRDDGLADGDPLRVAIGELATQRTTRRLSLPPLSPEAVALLADGTGLEPAKLYQLTAGNPFFVNEVLHHGVGELPSSARDAVLAHVANLSGEARQALDVSALIGIRVEPALLDAVTHSSPESLDELFSCGALTGDGEQARFRHEIARMAVEQSIAAHRRAPIHRGILTALLSSGCDDDARLAFHAESAGDGELVLTHAPLAAGRASALKSHREAAAQYERALRFAKSADDRTKATLYDALAYETSLVDRWQDSADARETALVLWRKVGDPLREGDTLRLLSRAMWRLCRGTEARSASETGLQVLEPLGPSSELAWAYASVASLRMAEPDEGQALALAQCAQELAEKFGLPEVVSDALNTQGCIATKGDGDWQGLLDRALSIAVAEGLQEEAGRAYANLYTNFCGLMRFAEGERYFVEGLAYCDDHDISTYGTCLRGERTSTLTKMGRWDEASALAEQLLDRVGASPVNRLNPLISLGSLRARRGEPGVWECLDEAASSADRVEEPQFVKLARTARAEAHWIEGNHEAAILELQLAGHAAAMCDIRSRGEVTVWRRRIGGSVPHAAEFAEPQMDDWVEPFATQLAGDCARAAELWESLCHPYEAAMALLDSTDESLLRDALKRLEQLGATASARVARRKMRDIGVKSIPSGARLTTREHPAGLTVRECEVLALICEGRTNDEISDRLFISAKTVDHHVSAVLGKLGVPTRKVAAVEAVRLGLVGAQT